MPIRLLRVLPAAAALVLACSTPALAPPAHAAPALSWRLLPTGTTSHFRGLAAVSRNVAWLGGYDGLILRTSDGGKHWTNVSPAGAGKLQFRDISADNAQHAVAMAAGDGTDSRLYETDNGGRTWTLAYRNTNSAAFFDCMSFSDAQHGLVVSDPVGGKFRILSTSNGGARWTVLSNAGMPAALTGEAGFAASGECLTTLGANAWFGTGGGDTARVFHSRDRGLTWTVSSTPIVSSASGGVFGLAFRNTPDGQLAGVAVGGDFNAPAASADTAAATPFYDTWVTARRFPSGYRSGVTNVPNTDRTLLAVGLTGSDVSYDGGIHWTTFDTGQFDTVSCTADGACWASGDLGRIPVLQR